MDIPPYARMVYDGGIDIVVFPQLLGVHLGGLRRKHHGRTIVFADTRIYINLL